MTTSNLYSLVCGDHSARDRSTTARGILDERHRHEQLPRRDDPVGRIPLRSRRTSIIYSNAQYIIAFGDASTIDPAKTDMTDEVRQHRRDQIFEANPIVGGPGGMSLTSDEFEVDDALQPVRSIAPIESCF
jgi:hypothetical protein